MVATSTGKSTDTLTFTIQRAFALCEVGEYDEAASSLPAPDLESSNGELLFIWGVTASGQGMQDKAKDFLSKAVRLLPKDRSELAGVYLALCYWRLGESAEVEALLSILLSGQARFCSLLVQAIIATEQGNESLALALLAEVEIEGLSEACKGKFFQHRALALAKSGEWDRALIDFEAACFHFQDAPRLLAPTRNNLARLYSKLGQLDKALKCSDEAISLTNNRQLLGQFHDQKARVLLDHGRVEQAKIEAQTAVSFLANTERQDFLDEALATQAQIKHSQQPKIMLSSSAPEQFHSLRGGWDPLTPDRATELIDTITRENDAEHAWELIEFIAKTADPNNVVAQLTLRRLFTLTEEFEDEYQRQMRRFISPENQSQAEN